MPAASKSVVGIVLFAKNEGTYGAGPSSALTGSTDAIQTILDHPVFDLKYAYDGNRNGAAYSAGNYLRVPSKGRTAEGTVKIEGKGAAATYTLSVTPPNLHAFMLASGMSGSMQSATWVYKPVPLGTAPNSLALNVYSRGELTPVSGAFCTFKIDGSTPGPTVFEFTVMGLPNIPSTLASPPARTWTASGTLPPNNTAVALSLGGYSPVVRGWSYEHGQEIVDRQDLNAQDGHAGKALGRRNPVFKCTIEADALSSFDPYSAQASGTLVPLSNTVGSVANNRFAISMPYAQITEVAQTQDGPVATWDLTLTAAVQNASSDDDVVISWT